MHRPMRRGGPLQGKIDLKKINPQILKRLLGYLKPYRLPLAFVVFFIIISGLTGAVSSLFLKILIDDYITPLLNVATPVFTPLLKIIGIMAFVYCAGAVATLFYNRIMATVAQGVLKNIRDEMFAHMQTLPVRFFDRHSHGDVMSYYTNDTDTLRQMITMSLPQMVSTAITLTSVFFAMLFLSFWLTVFVLFFVGASVFIMRYLVGKSGTYFVRQQYSLGDINGYIEEMVSGLKVVKVFNHEPQVQEAFNKKNEALCHDSTEANKYANILMPVMHNLGYVLYVLVAFVGGLLAISSVTNLSLAGAGLLSLGAIASFLQLSRNFINPLAHVTQQLNSIIMALAGAERIFSLLDEASEEDHGTVTLVNARKENGTIIETAERAELWAWKVPEPGGKLCYTELKGGVNLNDVDFGYNEGDLVLHNITLYAEPGQKVAFVGATGAGKTTITNLINRFYDIADGKIRYDGININKIKKHDLRRSLGMVLQDVHLFTGTVMENIRYGRLNATDEDCIEAAKLAHADSFIRMLPQGYNTVLKGDGNSLSQGQKQLISIARAAVADPPVMILDEATSSIDTRTEAIVQKGMDSLMQGRTVFVIAHRLSTVQNADVIMVLDEGRIIERGSHEKLIAEQGRYYQLQTGAFELE